MTDTVDFGLAICGGGPAGIGPLVAAARSGRLEELLDLGVLLVEPGPVGPGGLAHHRIAANSLGGPFLECLDELSSPHFAALRDLPETRLLREHAGTHPPLSVVAPFLARLGAVVVGLLEAHPGCEVRATSVTGLRLLPAGVGVELATGATVGARRAVIATGGRPFADHRTTRIVPGLDLAGLGERVHHSEAFIDARRGGPRAAGRVVIVGGAHSAWSVADLLVREPEVREITVVHRTSIRLFYLTAAEALAAGYPFDAVQDVCPAGGQVNRYGGLRGRARELARAALGLPGTEPVPVRLLPVGTGDPAAVREARRALRAADLVVVASGFEAALPPIRHPDGSELVPAVGPTGTVVTATGHLTDVHGRTFPELVAYGLGAGLAPSAEIGGEPSYRRRADGVWLYQHDIGDVVLDDLLGGSARSPEVVRVPEEERA